MQMKYLKGAVLRHRSWQHQPTLADHALAARGLQLRDRRRRGPSSIRAGNHQHGWEPALARGERPRSPAVLGTRLTTQTKLPQGGGKADTSARHPSPAFVRDGAGMLTAKSRACSVIPSGSEESLASVPRSSAARGSSRTPVIPFAIVRACRARTLSSQTGQAAFSPEPCPKRGEGTGLEGRTSECGATNWPEPRHNPAGRPQSSRAPA